MEQRSSTIVPPKPAKKFRMAHRWDEPVFGIIASFAVVLLFGIFLFLLLSGIRTFASVSAIEFFSSSFWDPTAYNGPKFGILSLFVGTLYISFVAMIIAVPVGLAIAICLSEIMPKRLAEILKPAIEMIAGIPSVVLGLLGLIFLAPLLARAFNMSNGLTALTSGILVGIAVLPTIASICEDALSSVPQSYRQASLALGATPWETIRHIVLPSARSGVIAGIMLGLGRAIGETMIVLMVAGNSLAFPTSLLQPVRPVTAAIAIEIKEVTVGSVHWNALFALGCVLLIVTFLINVIADVFIHRKPS